MAQGRQEEAGKLWTVPHVPSKLLMMRFHGEKIAFRCPESPIDQALWDYARMRKAQVPLLELNMGRRVECLMPARLDDVGLREKA